jgi:hypothetical protein
MILAAALLGPVVLYAQPGKPSRTAWTVEETPAQVTLRLRSTTPVAYGYLDPIRPDLFLTCNRSTKAIEAYVDVGVKPSVWDFAIRLDQDPSVEYAGKMRDGSGAEVLHQLAIPQGQVRAFVADLVRHRALLLRFTRDRTREATWDLRGFDGAAGPLERGCGLESELAAARATPASPASVSAPRAGPRETKIGNWDVREKTSSLDDKPVVVLAASARGDWSQLVLRCQEATVEAYVVSGSVIDSAKKDSVTVPIAVDDERPREVSAGLSADLSAFFLPDATRLIQSLRGHKKFKVHFQRYRAKNPVDPVFDLSGLDRALEVFTKACPLD